MASNGLTLDDLQIKISVESAEAVRNINALANQLAKLGSFKASGLNKLATSLQQLNSVSGTVSSVSRAVADMGETAEETQSSFVGLGDVAKGALTSIAQYARTSGSAMLSAFGKTVTAPFRFLGNAVSGLAEKFSNLGRMVKRVAIYRMIRTAIRMVTQALKEGVSMLVEWDRTYGNNTSRAVQTTEEIKAKWEEVKKSLGAAAMPLIQIFQPALMAVMNTVIALANTINQILRSFQGYSTYMKATEKNWKSSVGSAKELQKILFGFDELNVLPSASGSGGASSGGGIDFIETDIDSGFAQNFGNTLKETIDGIKQRWDDFKLDISDGGSTIMAVLRFVGGVFQDVGLLAADALRGIGEGIKGLVDELGLSETPIGETLTGIGDLFIHFGDLVEGIFTLDLPKIVESVSNILNDISNIVDSVLDEIWYTIDEFLADLGERFGIDMDGIRIAVSGLIVAIKSILGIGLPFIFGTLFGWVEDIIKLFKGVFGEDGLPLVFEGLIQFIEGIFTGDWNTAWEGVIKIFKGIVNTLISVVEFLANAFISPFQALARAINNFKVNIPDWIPLIGGKNWNPQIPVPQKISIPRLASGGYVPNTGSLFWAGEQGAELVTRASGGTEVLNGTQVEQAMSNANIEVINAIYAMANMVVNAVNNKDTNVYLDAQKVGQSVSQYQLNYARAYGG